MRVLFEIDKKNYRENGPVVSRPSARAVIIRGDRVLLVYSKKYNYYKFPGGGIEKGEDNKTALVREVREETGYFVIPESITEYGMVPRVQQDTFNPEGIFRQDNYYYFCDVKEETTTPSLDDYEEEEGFTAVWQDPFIAFNCNRYHSCTDEKDIIVINREQRVLEMIYYLILERVHLEKERSLIAGLGHPEYFEMVDFVKECLEDKQTEDIGAKKNINYSRFEHTKRVLAWAKRLYDRAEDKAALRYDELMIATIFHDAGRNNDCGIPHAKAGVPITREYLLAHGYPEEKTEYICMLVGGHSDKWRMQEPDIDRNLLLLMEADLLDDMGAQGIVMDCMITQKRKDDASFYDCYNHIHRYTYMQHRENPMVTPEGRLIWEEKTKLVDAFDKALEQDIGYSL